MRLLRLAYFVSAIAILIACDNPQPQAPPMPNSGLQLSSGYWRGEMEHFGDTLPFNFEVENADDGVRVYYLNGLERMPVERVSLDVNSLQLDFPSYNGGLTARVEGNRMSGTVRLARMNETLEFPFQAELGPTHRFYADRSDEYVDVSGKWSATIRYPGFGFEQPAIAEFEQTGPFVSGSVLTEVGDFRYLYGEVRGNELALSAFDGGYTQLWRARLEDGKLRGTFDSATYANATWEASQDQSTTLRDPTEITYIEESDGPLDFTFPNLQGENVSLSDAKYENKVVVVVLAGTWCPSCHDEAAFMAPYYEANRDRGLEIINLMFEYSDRLAESRDQIEAFRQRYGIQYDLLFAGASSRATRGALLPMLNQIFAFPTTIFVDRQGKVRKIYTAFPGPATGDAHQEYVREFSEFMDMLLAEPAA